MKHRILFVCLGNICRSPAAEGVFSAMAAERGLLDELTIDSAGTYGGHSGELPDARMRASALQRGYELVHRSRKLRRDDFDRFDKIIVMDDSNYDDVYYLAPDVEATNKVCRMADYCKKYAVDHVPDPYYEGQQGIEYVLDIIEEACENLLNSLINE